MRQDKPFYAHWRAVFFIYLCLLSLPVSAANEDLYSFHSAAKAGRFTSLIKQIRCVVCQSQTIADSEAPLAKDMRSKIYKMVSDNQSDQEIKAYLVKRYGEFILLQPRFNKLTIGLWLFPLLFFTGIFLAVIHFVRRLEG